MKKLKLGALDMLVSPPEDVVWYLDWEAEWPEDLCRIALRRRDVHDLLIAKHYELSVPLRDRITRIMESCGWKPFWDRYTPRSPLWHMVRVRKI